MLFSSVRDVVAHNHGNPLFPKQMRTAAAIASRHALPLIGGTWTFSHDVRTYGEAQPLRISPRQLQQFLDEPDRADPVGDGDPKSDRGVGCDGQGRSDVRLERARPFFVS